jgi:hypothetical protein
MQIYIIGSEQTELNEVKLLLNKKSPLYIVSLKNTYLVIRAIMPT